MKETKERKLYDLTYPQKSIVSTENYYDDPHISTIVGIEVIKSAIDFKLLKRAIHICVSNHDIFSIRFTKEDNEIKQYFDSNADIIIGDIVASSLEELETIVKGVSFKLLDSKLYDLNTFKTDDGLNGYTLVLHHAITDAWSEVLFVSQVNQIYDALLHGKPADDFPKSSYLDIIDKENHYLFSDKFIKDKEYWDSVFADEVELPNIRNNHRFDTEARRITFPINNKYYTYCIENKISPFSFFLASIFIYFSRIYNNKNIIIGTPVLNRTNYQDKNVMGMFISTQGFKQFVDKNISIKSFIENISSTQFSLLRHQKYPLELIQKSYRTSHSKKQNLYDILFSYQNARMNTGENLSFEYEGHWIFTEHQADCLDINIFDIDNTGNLNISYDYLVSLYTAHEIEAINNRLNYIMDQMISNPEKQLKSIEIVTNDEKTCFVKKYNKTFKKYDHSLTITKLFEDVVVNHPNDTALVFDGKELSYKELNDKANYLANILRNNGIGRNEFVGIIAYRSFEMIISMLAILKAGAAYLPIDPSYPKERINYMLENSDCSLLLVSPQIYVDDYDVSSLIVDIEKLGNLEDNLQNINQPDDLAYTIYTSGSTGKPKGVKIKHESIINTLIWRKNYYDFDSSFTTLQIPSFSFDSSVEDIFTSLISGGKLILLKQNNTNYDLPMIYELIRKYKVNHILAVPSFYNVILNELTNELYDAKIFTVAGEGFAEELVTKHFELLPKVRLVNEYGPTENSVCSTFYEFDKDHTKIKIGVPIDNCACYLLNEDQMLQPYNVKGELYVSGPGLAEGYIKNEELTSERFVPNPYYDESFEKEGISGSPLMYKTGDICVQDEDGLFTYLERADFQVKYNGYRINLGEIEDVISRVSKNPNVVVVLKNNGDKNALIAYIETQKSINVNNIKNEISKYLPHYMIPKEIYSLSKFPVTPNRKIDRLALQTMDIQSKTTNIIEPRNLLDKTILDIWKQVLNVDKISIDTSIFDIGGDSLSIIAIQSLLFKVGIHTKVQDLFENPTILELSDFIKSISDEQNEKEADHSKPYPRLFTDNIESIKKAPDKWPKGVFLTGSTGFLGAHILNELMKNDNINHVYCIVREKPKKSAEDRIKEVLNFYFDGKWIDEIGKKLIILKGDLSREMFGLNPSKYKELFVRSDAIINCASLVKHFGLYDLFYNSNVLTVQNLITFAKEALCPINHISTTSVSGNYLVKNDLKCDFTENDFYIGQNYKDNVYIRSKFEAENLLFKAQQENVKVNIFRVGNIMPRTSDNKFQINSFDNAYYKRIHGFANIGILPENIKTQQLEFSPVDCCAKAIVSLIKYENKVFHIQNDNTIDMSILLKILEKNGKSIQFVSPEEFRESIQNSTSNKQLESFITDLDYNNNLDYSTGIKVTDKITLKYLENEGFKWPNITEEYLNEFVVDLLKDNQSTL